MKRYIMLPAEKCFESRVLMKTDSGYPKEVDAEQCIKNQIVSVYPHKEVSLETHPQKGGTCV